MSPSLNNFQSISRRTKVIGAFGAAALLITVGCQDPMKLPVRKAGAKCSPVGAQARTSTHVLECKPNRRWTKIKTLAEARADYARSLVPPATAPTTSVKPLPLPLPTIPETAYFGPIRNVPVGSGPGRVAPGTYVANATGTECGVERRSSSGELLGDRSAAEGTIIFSIPAGDGWISSFGPCLWTNNLSPQRGPMSGTGVYRVGVDYMSPGIGSGWNLVSPGRYTAPGSSDPCYWETATSADGSIAAITDNAFSTGPQMVEIGSADTIFVSDGCGQWTPMPVLPPTFFEFIGHPTNPFSRGHRAFQQGGAVSFLTEGGTLNDSVRVSTGAWVVQVYSGTNSLLQNGTYEFDANLPNAAEPLMTMSGEYLGCGDAAGSFTVSHIHRSPDNRIDGIDITFAVNCSNSGISYGSLSVAPSP